MPLTKNGVRAHITNARVEGDVLILVVKERPPSGPTRKRVERFPIPKRLKNAERRKFFAECEAKALSGAAPAPLPSNTPKPAPAPEKKESEK